jgi:hypothetical protein
MRSYSGWRVHWLRHGLAYAGDVINNDRSVMSVRVNGIGTTVQLPLDSYLALADRSLWSRDAYRAKQESEAPHE